MAPTSHTLSFLLFACRYPQIKKKNQHPFGATQGVTNPIKLWICRRLHSLKFIYTWRLLLPDPVHLISEDPSQLWPRHFPSHPSSSLLSHTFHQPGLILCSLGFDYSSSWPQRTGAGGRSCEQDTCASCPHGVYLMAVGADITKQLTIELNISLLMWPGYGGQKKKSAEWGVRRVERVLSVR